MDQNNIEIWSRDSFIPVLKSFQTLPQPRNVRDSIKFCSKIFDKDTEKNQFIMMITVYMELFDKTTCCELMLWQQYFYLLDEAHSLKR